MINVVVLYTKQAMIGANLDRSISSNLRTPRIIILIPKEHVKSINTTKDRNKKAKDNAKIGAL